MSTMTNLLDVIEQIVRMCRNIVITILKTWSKISTSTFSIPGSQLSKDKLSSVSTNKRQKREEKQKNKKKKGGVNTL